jgi:hypothetical protein
MSAIQRELGLASLLTARRSAVRRGSRRHDLLQGSMLSGVWVRGVKWGEVFCWLVLWFGWDFRPTWTHGEQVCIKRGAALVGDDEQIVRLLIMLLHDALGAIYQHLVEISAFVMFSDHETSLCTPKAC